MITFENYKTLTDCLGSIYVYGSDCLAEITATNNLIDNLQEDNSRTYDYADLQSAINRTDQIIQNKHVMPSKSLLTVVRKLQINILNSYASIDVFLSTGSIKVSINFASLSEYAGFSISSGNIDLG